MSKKTVKILLVALITISALAAVSAGLYSVSRASLKITLNAPADTIRVSCDDNDIKLLETGSAEAQFAGIAPGTYRIEIIKAGCVKENKEVDLGWNETLSESFILIEDTTTAANELETAAKILEGTWTGRFGKSTMDLVIENVKPGSISGFDKVDGKKRKVSGSYKSEEEFYDLTLNEPGDKSEDGQFTLRADKTALTAEGYWESFDKKVKYPVKFVKGTGAVQNKPESKEATEPSKVREPVLQILRATYGTAFKTYDVTSKLNARVVNDNIYVEASNVLFGDPDPGKPKQLTVSYKYHGQVYNKIIRENSVFRVP
jgi:hypothetical protein